MALGQIVPFQVEITVNGSTTPENGIIEFTPYWLAKTTSGGNFGFDPNYKVIAAFVDAADPGTSDPGNNAKVDSFNSSIAFAGTNDEQIQSNIRVSGLENGDKVIVEIWVVLKDTIPVGSQGNVQTGLVSAKTANNETINTGNQTVPLLRVQEFFSSDADLSVIQSDSSANPIVITAGDDPAQVALGSTFSVIMGDLGGTSLGETLGVPDCLIVKIDDDAAGYGWSTSLDTVNPNQVDLFSTLTHEFGHILGFDHDDMGEALGVGERHLPLDHDHFQQQYSNVFAVSAHS
jgi:hypothetical protein